MKRIILNTIMVTIASLAILGCCPDKTDPSLYGTGKGKAYIKVFPDLSKLTPLAKNFEDIKSLIPDPSAGKTYKENKLNDAFRAISTYEERFLKALAAKKALEVAKKNKNANVTEIDKEFVNVIKYLKFVDGDENTVDSYDYVVKIFKEALEE
ncbi:hypothetical protein baBA2_000968 (plasmid) [Borrelia anserina]|uniref:Uncharacterized protein n=2 Tax=Borrelia anserina TaxID=143 RepID=W5SVB4_BORAN|nr:hypothetical protein [Borrelia anserina]AHH08961.1 hypothetical protein BAN_0002700 [Borrelia anserina BA2]APR65374.1 Alp [Borrelia anserina Es]UPA07337.1 hypothetical protein baBA2_000968 [Borrelia anserina]